MVVGCLTSIELLLRRFLLPSCRDESGESSLIVNFDTDLRSSFFAKLYQHSELKGGHVVMLGADQASRPATLHSETHFILTLTLFKQG
jgi:hypothetical protein